MSVEVRVPVRGEGMESALISEWYVHVGDQVEEGAPLFAIETAKAVYDVAAPTTGTVLALHAQPGDEVAVHEVVAVLGEPGEELPEVAAPEPGPVAAGSPTKAEAAPTTPDATPTASAPATTRRRPASSPRARWTAEQAGIPLEDITGTGPGGRITVRDVQRHRAELLRAADARAGAPAPGTPAAPSTPATPSTPAASTTTPFTGVRAVIAQRMTAAAAVPAVTLDSLADARQLRALQARLREHGERWGMPRTTVNDLVCALAVRVLRRHPALNAWCTGDAVTVHERIDLGVAVDTPHGLLVPVVRDAAALSVAALSARTKELAAAARERHAAPEDLQGSTFSVSNLGAFGVRTFTPMLNLPEVAILGVGAIHPAVLPDAGIGDALPLSLTFDHRAVDGATAAAYLRELCEAIATPDVVLNA